ncbi:MAG: hypothetical protein ACLSCV_03015 [Acutalibacteraceae bacterium]
MEFTVNGIASGKVNETLSANVRIQRTENGANAQVTQTFTVMIYQSNWLITLRISIMQI